MPAFEAIAGMPYWIDLRTTDVAKSRYFYSHLLGWEISQEPYAIARKDGLPVAGILPAENANTWVTHFLTHDIEQSLRDVVTAGGRDLTSPLSATLGTIALASDSAGAVFGLIQPAGEDAFVAAGEPGTVVWHDYSATSGFAQAQEFYGELFSWTVAESDGFATALIDGSAFAGLRDASAAFGPDVDNFWQSFIGVSDVDDACRRAAELGGEVVRAPLDTEFGRLAIIADSTGAVVTLCEVDEPVDESAQHESDDLFHL
ncbi:VOC family protein [Corynebacterium tapiri]|uniref:VOC family protein n=1 Tax=Corynebacterium tapiri TaxID=1448266 RepID=A0A5C4U3U3_9CORY|nr:VOC family protein [Corynebacterium tapiri]TNL96779.1 VOC family protein [Corynebacterium tapiri]